MTVLPPCTVRSIPAFGVGAAFVGMVMSTVATSLAPLGSVTVSSKDRIEPARLTLGTVKVGESALASLKLTLTPPVCCHE